MEALKSSIWAIGGGKGGVGKSFIASNLSCGLALSGHKTVLIDADLTGSNLHTLFGIKYPELTLGDFMKKRVNDIHDVLVATEAENLYIICGAGDILELANPNYAQKQRLIRAMTSLEADYVVIDIGAGASLNNLDFFNLADLGIIVTTPTPTAIQNAYGFMKLAINRKLINLFSGDQELKSKISSLIEGEGKVMRVAEVIESLAEIDESASQKAKKALNDSHYRLIVNMGTVPEGDKISKAMVSAAYQFLLIRLYYLAAIEYRPEVEKSVRSMKPLMLLSGSHTSDIITKIVKRLISETNGKRPGIAPAQEMPLPVTAPVKVQMGINDDVQYEGRTLHVQTEDLGSEEKKILTLVFSDGRILFSKAAQYSELDPAEDLQAAVVERVKWQHKVVISGIMSGKLKDAVNT